MGVMAMVFETLIEGEMLLEFAEMRETVMLNTLFRKGDSRKVTYDSGGN